MYFLKIFFKKKVFSKHSGHLSCCMVCSNLPESQHFTEARVDKTKTFSKLAVQDKKFLIQNCCLFWFLSWVMLRERAAFVGKLRSTSEFTGFH